jgi:uncharacterized RDD family membrane protein YckC
MVAPNRLRFKAMADRPLFLVHEIRTVEEVAVRLEIAHLGSRLAAAAVDLAVQLVVWGALLASIGTAVLQVNPSERSWLTAASIITGLVVLWAYPTVFELAWHGQTPGKRALGLRVVRQDGGAIGLPASVVRNLLRVADLLPGFGGLGIVVCLLDSHGRRIGDLAAGTLVVHEAVLGVAPELEDAREDLLPAAWTGRRIRSALGSEGLTLVAETLARRPGLAPERQALVLAAVADRVRKDLGRRKMTLSDAVLLASVLARSRR